MAQQNRTTKLVRAMHDNLVCTDLDTVTAGYLLSRMSDGAQRALGDLVFSVLNQRAVSAESASETHPLYLLYKQSATMVESLGKVSRET